MLFGPGITPAADASAASWLGPACRTAGWTVGSLVPNVYATYLRAAAPPPVEDGSRDWWEDYRRFFVTIAAVGSPHTSSPDRAWFAVWEGHGYDHSPAVRAIPRFDRPDRAHFLLTGAVGAVADMRYPERHHGWRNPDLFWPDDRAWFVATDVDFWAVYVGGTRELTAAVAAALTTPTELVPLDHRLEPED